MPARPKLNLTVLDPGSGRARPGAWVSVYLANTLTLTTLWADDDVSTMANPVQANQLGQVAMRVNPGVYDISMSWDGAQPTVIEDVLAWTPEAAVITEPGDLIVGSHPSGSPGRLPVGQHLQVLTVNVANPTWQTLGAGAGLPWGPQGSLLGYGPGPETYVTPIPPGTQDQALAMAGGYPTWVSTLLPPGTTLPINQPGDLVVGAPGTGLPARLAVGALGSALTVSDNQTLVWSEPGGVGPGMGQCYLAYENSNSLWLTPFQGNKIWVNGRSRTIPDGGIRLAPTGLSVTTAYYIYVAWTGSALQLEASTIGFQQTGGLWHKSGDPSRTLVGYAWVANQSGTPVWIDADWMRGVLSLFNQDERTGEAVMLAPSSTTSVVPVPISAAAECYFIAWGFTTVTMYMAGTAHCNVSGQGFVTYLYLDGVALVGTQSTPLLASTATNISAVRSQRLPAENRVHTVSLFGAAQPGVTATWYGEASGLRSCRVGYTLST
jgi:hypothetical protein